MSRLRELQERFSEGIFDPQAASVTALIRANGLTGARRLQVYRNNVFTGFTEALRAVYPVIERLTGEAFFEAIAHQYIRNTPNRVGNLHEFGDDFGGLLAAHPACAGFPYLADVARLEWAYHDAYHAADHAPLDLATLGRVDPEHYDTLVFALHPAVRLVSSRYPILRIWEVNQPDYPHEPVVDLDAGGARVLVYRRDWDIEFRALEAAEYEFLSALEKGQSLGDASRAAWQSNADFDLDACLVTHVTNAIIVGAATTSRTVLRANNP